MFAPSGARPRKDAACPDCGSRERHRLLWLYIMNETELAQGNQDILYFAPTDLIVRKLRESGNTVITGDLRMESVDVHLDITQLPFSDDEFDAIICSHVLEHIPDDSTAIAELYRVCASDGAAIVMVPKDKGRQATYEDESVSSPEERLEEFGVKDHVRLYGMDFPQRLSEAGFDVSVETYARQLGAEAIKKYGLRVNEQFLDRELEDIHYCRKSESTTR